MSALAVNRGEQRLYWDAADSRHFAWQTRHGYFAESEAELVRSTGLSNARRLLEIGCGEGGNLFHLGARPGWVGIDFSQAKLAFARRELDSLTVAQSDAEHLPFADETFDAVLIRDLLHHVPDRDRVLSEALRVLSPGGTIAVIEPNRYSPLILAQGALVRAERAALLSHAQRIRDELERAGFSAVTVDRGQPFPVARVLLHPRLGLSSLGAHPLMKSALRLWDRVTRAAIPRWAWMYLVARARRAA